MQDDDEDQFTDPVTGQNTMAVTGSIPQQRSAPDSPSGSAAEPKAVFSDRSKLIPPTKDQMKEIVPRHGALGVKGTLRDVLGILGDSFLLGSGHKANYRPIRQEEKKSDALLGMTGGPAAQREAIERLAQLDSKAGSKMMDEYEDNQHNASVLDSQDKARKALDADRRFTNLNQGQAQVARWFKAAGDDPDKQAAAMAYTKQMAERLEIDPADLLVSDQMSPAQRAVLAGGDMTVNQQTIDYDRDATRAQREQLERLKEAGRMKRDNPPAPRSQRAQTELEYYQAVGSKDPAKRTQAERDFYKKYTKGTGKGSVLSDILESGTKGGDKAAPKFRYVRQK
jgi:hypothetical protein